MKKRFEVLITVQLCSTIVINEFNFYLPLDSISKPFGTTYYRLLSGCKYTIAITNWYQ